MHLEMRGAEKKKILHTFQQPGLWIARSLQEIPRTEPTGNHLSGILHQEEISPKWNVCKNFTFQMELSWGEGRNCSRTKNSGSVISVI